MACLPSRRPISPVKAFVQSELMAASDKDAIVRVRPICRREAAIISAFGRFR